MEVVRIAASLPRTVQVVVSGCLPRMVQVVVLASFRLSASLRVTLEITT